MPAINGGGLIGASQGKQTEAYPRHEEPADAVASATMSDAMVQLNVQISGLEQLFNQAEYEERYWQIKRDELAVAIDTLRQARELIVQKHTARNAVPYPAEPTQSDRYTDRV